MATGNELILRIVDLVPEMGDNTGTLSAAEEARILRSLNAEREKIDADVASLGEDYQLTTVDFVTEANRSPNVYVFSIDIIAPDFKDIRYLEEVIDDAAGSYKRLWPISQLLDKDEGSGGSLLWHDLIGTNSPGRPEGYLMRGDSIQIQPISDAVYTLRLWYTQRYADIVATDTEINVPPELYDALVYASAGREKEFRREFEDATVMGQRAEISRQRGLANLSYRRDDPPHLIHYMGNEGDYV